jgi:hypothetical protein
MPVWIYQVIAIIASSIGENALADIVGACRGRLAE